MSDKRLDLSVLPDGFLIEQEWRYAWEPKFKGPRSGRHSKIRPALNYWHFNDGSMVLPDGLVIEFQQRDKEILTGSVINGFILVISHGGNIVDEYELEYSEGVAPMFINGDIIAVKIIGVTQEYKEHGAELGMEVIE